MGAIRQQVRHIAHGFVAPSRRAVEEEVAWSGGGAGEVAGNVLKDDGSVTLQSQEGGDDGRDEVGDATAAEAVGVDGVPFRGHVTVECDSGWCLRRGGGRGGWRCVMCVT